MKITSSIITGNTEFAEAAELAQQTLGQADGLKSGRRFQCGVSLPKGTETNVESALTAPSHFGVPDQTSVNVDGSRVVRWLRHFEGGNRSSELDEQRTQFTRQQRYQCFVSNGKLADASHLCDQA